MAAFVSLFAATGAVAQPPAVSVYPSPNTTSALPGTQITFRGIPASQIGSVQVAGSSTGAHGGAIQADSDGQGGSFIPSQPFAPGETVTVTTGLNVVGGSSGAFHFAIASPFGTIDPLKLPMVPAGSDGVQHFHTRSDLEPASITIKKRSSAAYNGDIFLTPQYGPLQNGPMLLDPSGRMIWFQPLPPNQLAADFRVQQLGSQPVLTWWQGFTNNGSGRGEGVIYNTAYQQIATVQAGNGLQGVDLHEFLVTPQGDAYIVAVSPVHYGSLTKPLMDAVVQEIDIKTGLVLFEWHALDHVPVSESFFKTNAPGHVYDPYHLNSIALDRVGNLVVSMRNTWAVYKIDHQTGAITLDAGQQPEQFQMGLRRRRGVPAQRDRAAGRVDHDVRRRRRTADGSPGAGGSDLGRPESQDGLARPAVSAHPGARHRVRGQRAGPAERRRVRRAGASSPTSRSSARPASEIFDARFTSNTSSYRAYRMSWSGQPNTSPSIAAAPNNDGTTEVWASWNGATTVSSWQVLAGPSAGSLTPLMTARKGGFETGMAASTGMPVFAVQALASNGQVLATSGSASVGPHIGIAGRSAFVSAPRRGRPAGAVHQLEHLPHRGHHHRRAHGDRADGA